MKLHQKVSLYIVALIVLASLATDTFASCVTVTQGPPCQEFWRAQAVFIGTATRVVRLPHDPQLAFGEHARTITHFSVDEAFRGVEGTVIVLDSSVCGYPFKEGEQYLVYAQVNINSKKLEVRAGWTRTAPLAKAAEDLAYIRSLPSAPSGFRIYGKVFQHGFKVKTTEPEPLRDVRVFLEMNDERREVVTDSEGRYEFKGVSAGSYQLRVDVPSYLDYREQTIKATDRGCLAADLFALYKGRIAGRVLDTNGKPVSEVGITLVSADVTPEHILSQGKDKAEGPTTYSNRDGTYSFSQMMPGRYLLIVNHFGRSRSELVNSLPRLFYPGVNDIGAATVIVVAADQKPQEYDFVLPIQQ